MLLRIAFDAAYPGLIADTVNDLRSIRPGNAVHVVRRGTTTCVVVSVRWRLWDRVFPQHGAGPTAITTRTAVARLDEFVGKKR